MESWNDQEIIQQAEIFVEPAWKTEFSEQRESILLAIKARIDRVMRIQEVRTNIHDLIRFAIEDWQTERIKIHYYKQYCQVMEQQGYAPVNFESFNKTGKFRNKREGIKTPFSRWRFLSDNQIGLGTRLISDRNEVFVVRSISSFCLCILKDSTGQISEWQTIDKLDKWKVLEGRLIDYLF